MPTRRSFIAALFAAFCWRPWKAEAGVPVAGRECPSWVFGNSDLDKDIRLKRAMETVIVENAMSVIEWHPVSELPEMTPREKHQKKYISESDYLLVSLPNGCITDAKLLIHQDGTHHWTQPTTHWAYLPSPPRGDA